MGISLSSVGKWDMAYEVGVERVGLISSVHSYFMFIHKLSRSKHRFEQGFSSLYTDKPSGYYDYLYIHRSRCETNLSQNWGAA